MCLATYSQFKSLSYKTGYKVFRKLKDGTLLPCYFSPNGIPCISGITGDSEYKVGNTYCANHTIVRSLYSGMYFAGFHVCKTLNGAIKYAKYLNIDGCSIVRVDALCYGEGLDELEVDCYLASLIKLEKTIVISDDPRNIPYSKEVIT